MANSFVNSEHAPRLGRSVYRDHRLRLSASPIVGDQVNARNLRVRLILFLLWLGLVAWFLASHTFWRDEVRAFSLALSGSNVVEMLEAVHGEGHPALWYLLLRAVHSIIPFREALPVTAAIIGIATMALVAFRAPFRPVVVGLVLFSFYGAFDYVVTARNYGISALIMLSLAALYPRVKDSLWLGLLLVLLTNTNLPSGILAACFLLLRFVELAGELPRPDRSAWLTFLGNAAIAAIGAYLAFRTVYPTFNDGAVSANLATIGPVSMLPALLDSETAFSHLAVGVWPQLQLFILFVSCLAFIRRPAALIAAITAFVGFKLFFYFIYPSSYRHEALFLFFLLSLHWLVAEGAGGKWSAGSWTAALRTAGAWCFIEVLALQTLHLIDPIRVQLAGVPYSRSADVAALLADPRLSNAIVMADPDPLLEPLSYYSDNPLWFLREQYFGKVVRLSRQGRFDLTLDDILADSEKLHRRTGRPIVILTRLRLLEPVQGTHKMMYDSTTTVTMDALQRFRSATEHVASLRPAATDENYDVFVYPRGRFAKK
jgi:hypothetical protein